uniref:Uncharacterized protein n=1 Tax=Trypanosoma congolense (strain IL3000) TaxID=1068625 RepID=G0UMC8_TRYCI|nr:hypothetical protein, unlikely [Trypanosoma congolense IL3000]
MKSSRLVQRFFFFLTGGCSCIFSSSFFIYRTGRAFTSLLSLLVWCSLEENGVMVLTAFPPFFLSLCFVCYEPVCPLPLKIGTVHYILLANSICSTVDGVISAVCFGMAPLRRVMISVFLFLLFFSTLAFLVPRNHRTCMRMNLYTT